MVGENEKECCSCKASKPLSQYGPDSRKPDGRKYRCRDCEREYNNQLREKQNRNPSARDRAQRKYRYKQFGLTIADYEQILKDQGGVCAICGQPPNGRDLCIDHCHRTGKVRGLLCDGCNTGIGKLGDDASSIRKALIYLQQSEQVALPEPMIYRQIPSLPQR
ncbi:MAG: hypothetical protein CL946_06255 [Ectothiorhodospiraceae bacterium]|nr:hypothetical protein [Ectothiorhodospiraceae bacterium]